MQKILTNCTRSVFHQFVRSQLMEVAAKRAKTSSNTKVVSKMIETQPESGTPNRTRPNPALMKIDTPEFRSIFNEELNALIGLFQKYNHEIRIAGGAVRDILMHIPPKDIDLATTATPDEMKEMFTRENVRMINAKGEKHGTITPRINNKENFEVTTLRIDVRTDGRHAEVQFTTDWQLDANRRDLTINSMFLGFDGTLYDYFYGYDDVQERKVLFVGNAEIRICEDYLRILRYFRFYGRIAKEPHLHDGDTLNVIKKCIDGLERISGERIWAEMQKIVVGRFGSDLMLKMLECGISEYCGLPKQPNIKEFQRLSINLQNFKESHHPIMLIIALLHSTEDAIRLHERLKLSAFERDLALFITQQRDKVDVEYKSLRDYQKLCIQPYARRDFVEQLLKYSNKQELYKALKLWQIPKFPINGLHLKERGAPQGKKMGLIMSELKLIWADSDFSLGETELLDKYLPDIVANMKSPPSSPNLKRKSN